MNALRFFSWNQNVTVHYNIQQDFEIYILRYFLKSPIPTRNFKKLGFCRVCLILGVQPHIRGFRSTESRFFAFGSAFQKLRIFGHSTWLAISWTLGQLFGLRKQKSIPAPNSKVDIWGSRTLKPRSWWAEPNPNAKNYQKNTCKAISWILGQRLSLSNEKSSLKWPMHWMSTPLLCLITLLKASKAISEIKNYYMINNYTIKNRSQGWF